MIQDVVGTRALRHDWVDVAKGISIVLVVLHHAVSSGSTNDAIPAVVIQLNATLAAFRMPLFFFLSGLFIASSIGGDLRRLLDRRLLNLIYLFALWFVIKVTYTGGVGAALFGRSFGLSDYIFNPLWPPLTLWFIYALGVFTFVAWLLRRVPAAAVVAATVALHLVLVGEMTTAALPFPVRIINLFLWFYLGHVLSARVMRTAGAIPSAALLLAPAYFAVAFAAWHDGRVGSLTYLVLGVAAIPVGIVLGQAVARSPAHAVVAWLGRHTLPIYVAHFMVLIPAGVWRPQEPALAVVKIGIVTVLCLAVPLLIEAFTKRVDTPWLFALPAQLKNGTLDVFDALAGRVPRPQPR